MAARSVVNSSAQDRAAVANPFRGFLLTYALTVSSLAVVAFLWGKVGFDLLVVGLGWPHILLGLAFNLNRVKASDTANKLALGALLLLTLAIAFVHSLVPITTVIYLYFIFHAFRDEIFIYHQRSTHHRFRGPVFDKRGLAFLIATVALAIPAQFLPHDHARQLQWSYAQCGLTAILFAMALLRRPRRFFAYWPGARYALFASFLIVGAMTGMKVLRVNGLVAPLFFSFLVVFHYFSWYVFSFEKMGARPQAPRTIGGSVSFFQSISTPRGFTIAIVVMNVLSFALTYSYQVLGVSAKLAYGFDLKYFLYFLVLHVTTSFAPKGPVRIPALRPS